jgi:GT2 family glycosyltransferase
MPAIRRSRCGLGTSRFQNRFVVRKPYLALILKICTDFTASMTSKTSSTSQECSQTVSVVIATSGRPHVLHDTIISIHHQTVTPLEVIICVPDTSSIGSQTAEYVTVIHTQRGLTNQRNAGLRAATGDFILFLDDDIELIREYLEICLRIMAQNPQIALVGGWAFLEGLDRAEALERINTEFPERDSKGDFVPSESCYGCNMFVRSKIARLELFDEKLPLYGWLEDYDWSRRISRHGVIGWSATARVVHLRASTGRMNGCLFGYSQIANPLYLYRKGVMPFGNLASLWLRAIAGNIKGRRSPQLRGHILAFLDVLGRKVDPTRILEIR